ncbi:MAG: methyltransferase domain-containing protein [Dehalococcoidia bacterium]
METKAAVNPAAVRQRMAAGYSRVAERYQRFILPHFLPMAQRLVAALQPSPGDDILDLATGGGAMLDALAAHPWRRRLVAADLANNALEVARNRHPEADFVLLDLEVPPPFRQASFDVITCSFGLNHLANASACLLRLRPLLRPGGRIGVTSWRRSSTSALGRRFDEHLAEALGTNKEEDAKDAEFDRMIEASLRTLRSARRLRRLFLDSGYRIARVEQHVLRFSFSSVRDYVDYRLSWGDTAARAAPLGHEAAEVLSRSLEAEVDGRTPLSWGREYLVTVGEPDATR